MYFHKISLKKSVLKALFCQIIIRWKCSFMRPILTWLLLPHRLISNSTKRVKVRSHILLCRIIISPREFVLKLPIWCVVLFFVCFFYSITFSTPLIIGRYLLAEHSHCFSLKAKSMSLKPSGQPRHSPFIFSQVNRFTHQAANAKS